MYKVSVIVPIYNAEKFLKNSLESLVKQTLKDIEIILVNDGSIDNSLSICLEYERKYKNVKVINKKNEGVSTARNVGLEHASGKFIAFMDADDEVELTMYEVLYDNIEQLKTDVCYCNYSRINSKEELLIDLPYPEGKMDFVGLQEFTLKMIAPTKLGDSPIMGSACRALYKRELIDRYQIKFRREINYMEDLIFNVEYLTKCTNICITKKVSYKYYYNQGYGVRGYKSNLHQNTEKAYLYLKNALLDWSDRNSTLSTETILGNFRYGNIITEIRMIAHPENTDRYLKKIKIIRNIITQFKKESSNKANKENKSLKYRFFTLCLSYNFANLMYIYFKLAFIKNDGVKSIFLTPKG